MSHRIQAWSSIARPLEPAYRSNLAILILAPLVGLAAASTPLLAGGPDFVPLAFALQALKATLVAFLAWALGREADPDRVIGSFIALALTAAVLIIGVDPALWTLVFILMASRMVNRTVGPPARLVDLVIILILCALAIFRDGYALMGLVGALAFALDAWFDRARTLNLVFALIAIGFTVATYVQTGFGLAEYTAGLRSVSTFWWALGGFGVLAGLLLSTVLPAPVSRCDATGDPLERRRVCAALVVITAAWAAGAFQGEAKWEDISPLLAVIFGGLAGRLLPDLTRHSGPGEPG